MRKPGNLSVAIRLGILAGLMIIAGPVTTAHAGEVDAQKQAQQRAMFRRGAQLWPVYCNMCHNARPGSEFSPAEWNMIMMHMRSQANLPPDDARAILEYLKASHQ
jgi:cytochrome c5